MRLAPPTLLRVTPVHLLKAGELTLLVAVAFALARLFWLLVTPLGPVGDWRPALPSLPSDARRAAIVEDFAPFGSAQAGAQGGAATSVSGLTLHGLRTAGPDGGGAIIGLPDGTQASIGVGEEVLPGMRLVEVRGDRVILDDNGRASELVIEEGDIPPVSSETIPMGSPVGGPVENLPLSPRIEDGKVTGLTVTQADPTALASIGLKAGDVITAIRGKPIASAEDLDKLRAEIRPGARIALTVQRGSGTIPVTLSL